MKSHKMGKTLIWAVFGALITCGVLTKHHGWSEECHEPSLDRVADFAWNQSGKARGGYYMPISSEGDCHIQNTILGMHSSKCARMDWSDNNLSVLFFYTLQGPKRAYFCCDQVHPPKNIWECKHIHAEGVHPDLSHTAWVTMTDNFTYSFTVRCFHHIQQQGWVVFSTQKHLSEHLTHKLLHHAKSLGYATHHPDSYIIRSYDDSTCSPVCLF